MDFFLQWLPVRQFSFFRFLLRREKSIKRDLDLILFQNSQLHEKTRHIFRESIVQERDSLSFPGIRGTARGFVQYCSKIHNFGKRNRFFA